MIGCAGSKHGEGKVSDPPSLSYMKETILEAYDEFFDA
jgi:hypothetical protein